MVIVKAPTSVRSSERAVPACLSPLIDLLIERVEPAEALTGTSAAQDVQGLADLVAALARVQDPRS